MMALDPSHPEFRAFVRGMREQPLDDTVRIVMCDWLDEHGCEDLAMLFRGMLDVARVDPHNRLGVRGWVCGRVNPFVAGGPSYMKAEYALKRTWAVWPPLDTLGPASLLWRWHRGTLDKVVVDWGAWIHDWHRIVAFGPVGEVIMTSRPRIGERYGLSLYSFSLAQAVPGRERRSIGAGVVADTEVWDEAEGNVRWRMRDEIITQLLEQVWGRDEVGRFRIDDEVLDRLTEPGP